MENIGKACGSDLALGHVMQVRSGLNSTQTGMAQWRGQCHASLRAGVPPLRFHHTVEAPPSKKHMGLID